MTLKLSPNYFDSKNSSDRKEAVAQIYPKEDVSIVNNSKFSSNHILKSQKKVEC